MEYADSRNLVGKLANVFQQTVGFIISNLHHVQGEQGINSLGIPEIPSESIEELVANALIHRDYFISAPMRVFVFQDRVEIISPGRLPNNLTVENIKAGNSNARNPVLASFANHLIPYRGYGSGIIRALAKYPYIDFIDDGEGNLFKAILKRASSE
jgi:ATP-dependent DNA helicase RecG